MTMDKETYRLVKENNILLKLLLYKLDHVDNDNFPINVIANIFADKLMNR